MRPYYVDRAHGALKRVQVQPISEIARRRRTVLTIGKNGQRRVGRRSFVAKSSWSTARIVDWAVRSTGRTAAAALPALVPRLRFDDPEGRRGSALALAHIGSLATPAVDALTGALSDEDPVVRYWAAVALGRVGPAAARAEGALRRLEEDPAAEVREAAAAALEAILE